MLESRASTHRSRALAGALWCARWLLVLLLVWDQIGSPLHHHRHDSGVDAQWMGAMSHGDSALHAEERDDDSSFAHAVLAVRAQSERPPGAAAEAGATPDALVACIQALAPPAVQRPCAPLPPDHVPRSTHRSLPPAGRAPPLHA